MADKKEQEGPKKRRFKNPETFRERALKTNEDESRSSLKTSRPRWLARAFKWLFGPLVRAYRKLKSIEQLKPLFVVLAFIGRIIFPKYFRTSFQELKKVSWPSLKESRKLTYAVLIFAVVFGASVAVVDWGLGKLFKHLLLK